MAQIMVSGGRIAQKLATLQLVELLHAHALPELLSSQLNFLFLTPYAALNVFWQVLYSLFNSMHVSYVQYVHSMDDSRDRIRVAPH
jgi:hypothetical protein